MLLFSSDVTVHAPMNDDMNEDKDDGFQTGEGDSGGKCSLFLFHCYVSLGI